jgi:hypothetical protein
MKKLPLLILKVCRTNAFYIFFTYISQIIADFLFQTGTSGSVFVDVGVEVN